MPDQQARRAAYGYDQRFELLGSAGMLQAGNVRPTEVTAYSKMAVSSDVPEAFFLERYRAAYALEIAHFFAAVTEGKPVRTTVADGLKALELAERRRFPGAKGAIVKLGESVHERAGAGWNCRPWAARARHAENLAWRVPGAALVRLQPGCGRARVGARNLPELALHDDYETLLADKTIDAVWLVTPTSLHPAQIIAALRAGKHVFCENRCRSTRRMRARDRGKRAPSGICRR